MYVSRDNAVRFYIRTFRSQGYYVSEVTPNYVKMVKPGRVWHWWHFFLTLATAGMWLPVWGVIALVKRPRVVFITLMVDHVRVEHG